MSFRRAFCGFLFCCLVGGLALRAQAPVQSSSSSSSKQTKQSSAGAASPLDSGTVSAGAYRNLAFGFTCKIPSAWVLRTDEMNERDEGANAGKINTSAEKAERVLLAAFSRPPEARAEDVNGSILIAAESATAYPGLKDAAQYFGPVTEVAKAQGFDLDGDPYGFVLGTKTLVRGDFEKNAGTRVMRQSTLVMLG